MVTLENLLFLIPTVLFLIKQVKHHDGFLYYIVLFDPEIGPQLVQPLLFSVIQEVIQMLRYSTFLKVQGLIVLYHIKDTRSWGRVLFLSRDAVGAFKNPRSPVGWGCKKHRVHLFKEARLTQQMSCILDKTMRW